MGHRRSPGRARLASDRGRARLRHDRARDRICDRPAAPALHGALLPRFSARLLRYGGTRSRIARSLEARPRESALRNVIALLTRGRTGRASALAARAKRLSVLIM